MYYVCTDLPGCTLHVQSTSHGKYLQGTGSVVGDNTGTKLLYSAYVHATGIRAVFLELPREIGDQHSSSTVHVVVTI